MNQIDTGYGGSGNSGNKNARLQKPSGKAVRPIKELVRTTFSLSRGADGVLKYISQCQGVPERDILERYTNRLSDEPDDSPFILDIVQKPNAPSPHKNTKRGTYAMTRKTVERLKCLSAKYGVSRDSLVEQIVCLAKDEFRQRMELTLSRLFKAKGVYEEYADRLADECFDFNQKIRALQEDTDIRLDGIGDAGVLLEDDLHIRIPRQIQRCEEILRAISWFEHPLELSEEEKKELSDL